MSPTFVAHFENGHSVVITRMSVHTPGGKLNMARGVRLARAAYEFANEKSSAEVIETYTRELLGRVP